MVKNRISRRFPGAVALVFLLTAMCSSGTAFAATGGDDESTHVAWSDAGAFTVTPMSRPAALLAPNARTPPPPAPLDAGTKAHLLVGSEGAPGTEPGAEPAMKFILSAGYTVHEQRGVLTLVQPHTFHPETGIHLRGQDDASVGVRINVDEGGRYLVDFQVRSAVAGRYLVNVEGEQREIEDTGGRLEHALVTLEAAASGWTTIRFSRPDSDFMLYAVEVTRAD